MEIEPAAYDATGWWEEPGPKTSPQTDASDDQFPPFVYPPVPQPIIPRHGPGGIKSPYHEPGWSTKPPDYEGAAMALNDFLIGEEEMDAIRRREFPGGPNETFHAYFFTFGPGTSDAADVVQLYYGENGFTHEPLTPGEYVLTVGGLLLPLVIGASVVRRVGRPIGEFIDDGVEAVTDTVRRQDIRTMDGEYIGYAELADRPDIQIRPLGEVYRVPGEGTPSKKPYLGSTDDMEERIARASDGRDRSIADTIDYYLFQSERFERERAAIIREGGLDHTDNQILPPEPR